MNIENKQQLHYGLESMAINLDEQKLIDGARKLIPLVRNKTIWFPFRRFITTDPRKLFEKLSEKYDIKIELKHLMKERWN